MSKPIKVERFVLLFTGTIVLLLLLYTYLVFGYPWPFPPNFVPIAVESPQRVFLVEGELFKESDQTRFTTVPVELFTSYVEYNTGQIISLDTIHREGAGVGHTIRTFPLNAPALPPGIWSQRQTGRYELLNNHLLAIKTAAWYTDWFGVSLSSDGTAIYYLVDQEDYE